MTYTIKTDIETSYAIACPLTCSLVSPLSYVSQLGTTVTVSPTNLMLTGDVGVKTQTINCVSTNFGATVTPVDYSFNVIIDYCIVDTFTIPAINDVTMVVNTGSQTVSFSAASFSNLSCLYTITYTTIILKNGNPVTPSFIGFNAATRQFTFTPTVAADVGVYSIAVLASIPQPSLGSGKTKIVEANFTLTVQNDCPATALVDMTVANLYKYVTGTDSVSLAFQNTKAVAYGSADYCGPNKFVFTPTLPSFLSFNAATEVLTLWTDRVTDVALTPISFSVVISLVDYPTITLTKTFSATLVCQVLSLTISSGPANMFVEPGATTQPTTTPFAVS